MSCVLMLMHLRDGFIKTTLLLIPTKKYHFLSLGKDTANETFIFKNLVMNNSEEQKYLGLL